MADVWIEKIGKQLGFGQVQSTIYCRKGLVSQRTGRGGTVAWGLVVGLGTVLYKGEQPVQKLWPGAAWI